MNLINFSPLVSLIGDVPKRVGNEKDASYNHLRVFGCWVFIHISKNERSKLDGKSK